MSRLPSVFGLTRRDALKLPALAALVACGDNTPRDFTFAIQTWTFRVFPLAEALDRIAALGVTRCEMSPQAHWGFPKSPEEIADLRDAIAARGLDCVTSGLEPVGDHELNRAVFEYARGFGLRTIMLDPPAEALDSLEALVEEFDLRVGIHNHGPGSRYSRIDDVAAALDGRDRRIGCIVDTGHYTRAGEDPVEALERFAGRVYGLHLKDVAARHPAAPDTILGEGVVDLVAVFRTLRAIEFPADASLSIEYEANYVTPYDDVVTCLANARAAAGVDAR